MRSRRCISALSVHSSRPLPSPPLSLPILLSRLLSCPHPPSPLRLLSVLRRHLKLDKEKTTPTLEEGKAAKTDVALDAALKAVAKMMGTDKKKTMGQGGEEAEAAAPTPAQAAAAYAKVTQTRERVSFIAHRLLQCSTFREKVAAVDEEDDEEGEDGLMDMDAGFGDYAIVPLTEEQFSWLGEQKTKTLMKQLQLRPANNGEQFWRIPGGFSAKVLKNRANRMLEAVGSQRRGGASSSSSSSSSSYASSSSSSSSSSSVSSSSSSSSSSFSSSSSSPVRGMDSDDGGNGGDDTGLASPGSSEKRKIDLEDAEDKDGKKAKTDETEEKMGGEKKSKKKKTKKKRKGRLQRRGGDSDSGNEGGIGSDNSDGILDDNSDMGATTALDATANLGGDGVGGGGGVGDDDEDEDEAPAVSQQSAKKKKKRRVVLSDSDDDE